ncbi:hypothetical protein [Nodularia sphaerocarpa]|uniref:hypothetical protein n=1 Tax=Nodularia sphaerocarpa TaxID=137816 RepID=UPI001EFA62A8|nr:hypothetical protein [Nodularia sphaerocarpa]MDB9372918.1 hypothetical protein [Nodularia sphaerocarpa CS-585]MDB9377376.1 hypothetical protein [Nodularia sphaerocarpa CS-585A2]ULP71656.1 hypothetical protein BDGGKGIB_01287 [Nodularia sphaerocarpa UHCC 0038]
MNSIFPVYDTLREGKGLFYLSSVAVAALTILGSGLPAIAETVDTQMLAESSVNATSSDAMTLQQFPNAQTEEVANRTLTPVPGTAVTSSVALIPESKLTVQSAPTQVAQADIDVRRSSPGVRNYVGFAGNIGIAGGDSSLGDGNFAIVSKVGLTNNLSIRPSGVFGNDTTILVPITYDLKIQQADPFDEPLGIAPFVGVGAALKTGDDSKTALLITGGIDFPLNPQFTATASVNAGFFRETDVGLLLGIGYNFSGF